MEIETDMNTVQAEPVQVNMEQGEVKTEQAESSVKHSKNKFKQAAVKTDESANGTDHKNGTSEDSKMETEEVRITKKNLRQVFQSLSLRSILFRVFKFNLFSLPRLDMAGNRVILLLKFTKSSSAPSQR